MCDVNSMTTEQLEQEAMELLSEMGDTSIQFKVFLEEDPEYQRKSQRYGKVAAELISRKEEDFKC